MVASIPLLEKLSIKQKLNKKMEENTPAHWSNLIGVVHLKEINLRVDTNEDEEHKQKFVRWLCMDTNENQEENLTVKKTQMENENEWDFLME